MREPLTNKQRESLERILALVERSLDAGIEAGQAEDRQLALGVIARDLAILKPLTVEREKKGKIIQAGPRFGLPPN